ncbi:hypothetical protein ACFW1J_26970 [Priestia aryabhattai]|uniref:hypothetical protein n=1 Tax=Priestia aryabhattai TaxID=412384 RepID=UPI00356466CC
MKNNCGCGNKPIVKMPLPHPPCPDITINISTINNSLYEVNGKVTCNKRPLQGVSVKLISSSDIVSFPTNPVTTNAMGSFLAIPDVAPNTSATKVTITALIMADGSAISKSQYHFFSNKN